MKLYSKIQNLNFVFFSKLKSHLPVFSRTYLNSTKAIRTQVALTLCSDVLPAPLKQVDDGRPAVFGLWAVLSKAQPEQSHQDEPLHAFPGLREKTTLSCCLTRGFYTQFLSLELDQCEISARRLNRCFFHTPNLIQNKWQKIALRKKSEMFVRLNFVLSAGPY